MADAFAVHQVTLVTTPVIIRTGDFLPLPPGQSFATQLPIPPVIPSQLFPTQLPFPPVAGSRSFRASRNYLIGPTVEVHLPLGLSVEADALYRPVSQAGLPLPSLPGFQWFAPPVAHDYSCWEFPVLGKYRLNTPFVKPFLGVGPSFRALASPLNHYWSKAGITAGLGVEGELLHLRIAPEVRYTHWGKDSGGARFLFASERNQAEFLVGLAF